MSIMANIFSNHVAIANDNNLINTGNVRTNYMKRLQIELDLLKDTNTQLYFRYAKHEISSGIFCIYGYLLPQKEPYNCGSYEVCIKLPDYFPFDTPTLELLTYIYHPAVQNDVVNPQFCCNCCQCSLGGSDLHIRDVIKYYVDIIDRPDLYYKRCDFNQDASRLYFQDKTNFEEEARRMVVRYAVPRAPIAAV